MSTPAIPTPAHLEIETMLSRRFGKEVTNYFSSASYFLDASFSSDIVLYAPS